jgi:hypothetical protein
MAHYTCAETCRRCDFNIYIWLILHIWLVALTECNVLIYLLTLTDIRKINRSRVSSVSIVTGLWDGWFGFFLRPNLPDRAWGPPNLLFNVISGGHSDQGVTITASHLLSSLWMSGVMPLLLVYVFIAWRGTVLVWTVLNTVHVWNERKTTVRFSLFDHQTGSQCTTFDTPNRAVWLKLRRLSALDVPVCTAWHFDCWLSYTSDGFKQFSDHNV